MYIPLVVYKMIIVFISIVLIVPYASLLLYYRRAWKNIPDFTAPAMQRDKLPFVSVIISARNEELKVADCLHALTRQTYPSDLFEVIVINDHSEDNTAAIISTFSSRFANISLLNLEEYTRGVPLNSYKKKAIETGIRRAKGELIITTDADCIAPATWITTIAAYYRVHQSAMIASPVSITLPVTGNWIQRLFYIFQILDFTTLQGITGAALFRKFHYMSNGANLAYPRNIFVEVGGFKGIDAIASGDDMLLMEKVRMVRPDKIHYLKSIDSMVTTFPERTLRGFFNQRIRWASKSAAFDDYKIKMVLLLVYMVNVWCLILFLSGIYLKPLSYFLGFIGLKILFEIVFLFPVTRFFQQQKRLGWFVLFQPLHILYIIIAGWLGRYGKYKWKGRRVK